MLNPTFFQVDTQDGEMRLHAPRLYCVDPRILDDLGMTDAEWASATGSSSVRVQMPRNGQQSAIAVDIIALMDALGIKQATIGGCDWARVPQI